MPVIDRVLFSKNAIGNWSYLDSRRRSGATPFSTHNNGNRGQIPKQKLQKYSPRTSVHVSNFRGTTRGSELDFPSVSSSEDVARFN
jgi:hypothetical protein